MDAKSSMRQGAINVYIMYLIHYATCIIFTNPFLVEDNVVPPAYITIRLTTLVLFLVKKMYINL